MRFLAEYGKFESDWFSRVVWSDESMKHELCGEVRCSRLVSLKIWWEI